MEKVMATSWNGGIPPVQVVNRARAPHIKTAVDPIKVARSSVMRLV